LTVITVHKACYQDTNGQAAGVVVLLQDLYI